MSHPDELLAAYVDGALAEGERAVVERHLHSCERCRGEVALARAAREALASVPEIPAPSDLGAAAIAEARRRATHEPAPASPSGQQPAWYRWAGAAAGIAAALLVVAVVLPHVGSGPRDGPAAGAAAPSVALPAATSVEAQNIDYDLPGVEALATSYSGQDRAFGSNNQSSQIPAAAEATPAQRIPFAAAVACLDRAFTDPAGQRGPEGKLVRVIQARFRGTPAILGVYLMGPGAGQPADIVRVLVASSADCSILTSTQATT